jgi:glutaredoxin
MTDQQSATLHRMVLSDHVCPFGLRAKELLEANGFQVDDRHLTTREQVEDFKAEHGLRTTPLIFIGEERIGGCDDLEAYLAAG